MMRLVWRLLMKSFTNRQFEENRYITYKVINSKQLLILLSIEAVSFMHEIEICQHIGPRQRRWIDKNA
ncbi:hypothetical protein EUGRSUZ_J01239 [Eucalyptus grandis]|uniref:Uncharacterized protein n=2 Tax=Eucalyptus grandis TaxID=71139 RepID=A0ACC3J579_EUCGR|nr:hypothetical protein EUGRSUZ_J01239 [Eucalyptus grandis]